ncbi:hypothetical protein V5T82_17925 [Magnetovibrio sp. PR-2]|uniref:hypothetical protein n=1 Tax=Magnetovibrio sp. PR-2 TaxID=3120356 RepID=UPI002FCE4F4C
MRVKKGKKSGLPIFRYRTPNGGKVATCGKFTAMDRLAMEYPNAKDWKLIK